MKTQITPEVKQQFQPGAILVNSWGYDQTNIDFFCIIERKGEWLKVVPMSKNVSEEIGFMTNKSTPATIIESKPRRKKLCVFNGEESGFSFGNYTGAGWCSLWKGQPETETHYA